jgi:hypothetical protein
MTEKAQPISAAELAKMHFLGGVPTDDRVVAATSYYHEGTPYFGSPDPSKGTLTLLPNTAPTWGAYWSKAIIDPVTDTSFRLLDTLAQHYSYKQILHPLQAVGLDLGHLATVVEKFMAFFDYQGAATGRDVAVRLMYLTEMEYLLGICRSLIDLLHECYRILHRINGGGDLPDTFGKFVDKEVGELVSKYKLPSQTAAYLTKVKPLFGMIRAVRDGIYHNGRSLERIFLTEDGPGICIDYRPYDAFKALLEGDKQYEETRVPNNVGSLFYLVVKIVDRMIAATDLLADTILAAFPKQPTYVKDGYQYYVRGASYGLLTSRQHLMKACWLRQAREVAVGLLDKRPGALKQPAAPAGTHDRTEWIARNAYFRWEKAGRPHDRQIDHWMDAEREYICMVVFQGRLLNSFT